MPFREACQEIREFFKKNNVNEKIHKITELQKKHNIETVYAFSFFYHENKLF
jgi:hypothetical protein